MAEENNNNIPEQGNVLGKYHSQKMVEEIKQLMAAIEDGVNGRGPVVKSIPIKAEWEEAWNELSRISEEHKMLDRKQQIAKDYFWALVHKGLDDFRNMRFNEKTREIEIYEDDNKNKS